MIRLARAEDIPRLQELLGQILLVHHYVRPDVLIRVIQSLRKSRFF